MSKIATTFIHPPIPDRSFDWEAIHPDTYDGAPDSKTRGHIGYGATEAEAIADLLRLDQEMAEAEEDANLSSFLPR